MGNNERKRRVSNLQTHRALGVFGMRQERFRHQQLPLRRLQAHQSFDVQAGHEDHYTSRAQRHDPRLRVPGESSFEESDKYTNI